MVYLLKTEKKRFLALFQVKEYNFLEIDCKRYIKNNFDWNIVTENFLKLVTKK